MAYQFRCRLTDAHAYAILWWNTVIYGYFLLHRNTPTAFAVSVPNGEGYFFERILS